MHINKITLNNIKILLLAEVVLLSSVSNAWYSTNGSHAMWEELNKKSPDCAAIFRTIFRKTEKNSSQTSIKDTFIYEGSNGKSYMDTEVNFDFSSKSSSKDENSEANSKLDSQLTKAETGLKASNKTFTEIMNTKPPGDRIPDDEEKNIFSRACLMVADTGFRDKSPCPSGLKGFKLNPQVILCKDMAVAAKNLKAKKK